MGSTLAAGYAALRESAAWLDLSARGEIVIRGEDRARLLHALSTNHVHQLRPGEGCYAFFLNAQGRILCDANILCFANHILLDTEPETAHKLFEHIDKYTIADDVTIEDATRRMFVAGLEGPGAGGVLKGLGAPVPKEAASHQMWASRIVARLSAAGGVGYRIFAPAQERDALVRQFEDAGAVAASEGDLRTVRVENGRPRYGEDISDSVLAQETQLTHALHFNKGCYLGQEIVERVRSRGHVNRLLVRLEIETGEPPPAGTQLASSGNSVGAVTSAVYSPRLRKTAALAYVRADCAKKGVVLEAGSSRAEVLESKPAAGA